MEFVYYMQYLIIALNQSQKIKARFTKRR